MTAVKCPIYEPVKIFQERLFNGMLMELAPHRLECKSALLSALGGVYGGLKAA